ncbi:MAG TPA: hypothetical protein VFS19_03055, partial [Planctomycetota bacterium]|nr:hypothetical protein [Planctomycetota bacterium]
MKKLWVGVALAAIAAAWANCASESGSAFYRAYKHPSEPQITTFALSGFAALRADSEELLVIQRGDGNGGLSYSRFGDG